MKRQEALPGGLDAFPKPQDRCRGRQTRGALTPFLGVKDQVIAQFGADSDELASLGLKKKSERKAHARSVKASK